MDPFDHTFNISSAASSPEAVEEAIALLNERSWRPIGLDRRMVFRAEREGAGIKCDLYDTSVPPLSTRLEFEHALRDAQAQLDASPLGSVVRNRKQIWTIVEQYGMTVVLKWGPVER